MRKYIFGLMAYTGLFFFSIWNMEIVIITAIARSNICCILGCWSISWSWQGGGLFLYHFFLYLMIMSFFGAVYMANCLGGRE